MIGQAAERRGKSVKFIGYNGCPPVMGTGRIAQYSTCFTHNQNVVKYLVSHPEITTVILASRWSVFTEGYDADYGPEKKTDPTYITDASGAVMEAQDRRALFASKMAETVTALTRAGKTVVLLYPIPETGYDIPQTLAAWLLTTGNPATFTRPADHYFNRQKFVFQVFDELQPAGAKLVRIYPHQRLCDETECIVYADGKPLYRDGDHVSLAGAEYLSPLFEPVFQ